jgi:hypothetical protein
VGCDVLLRIVAGPGRSRVDLRGLSVLEVPTAG